jgi:acyl-CoA synthetase (AMP-forming)/AMP-acid ligase II
MSDATTIPHVALASAASRKGHIAISEGDRQVSYEQLASEMRRAAAAFVRAGLNKGDRFSIWAHNGIDWIVACLGAQAAGGVLTPMNTRFKGGEAHYVLAKAKVRFLIHDTKFLGTDFLAMLEGLELPALERTISIPTDEAPDAEWAAFLDWGASDPAAVAEAAHRLDTLSPDDASDILFTSGTTGAPKGVVTNHGQNVDVYREWVRCTTLRADDRYLVIWPFFHSAGYKSGWLACMIAGATLCPEPTFDVDRLIKRVMNEHISFLPGPPTLFQSLLESPEGKAGKLASLRITVTGATTVAPSLIIQMRDELGLKGIFTGYGLTESAGTITMTSGDDGPEIVVTSCGKAIHGVEMGIMDLDNKLLAANVEGEIVTRGRNVMQGYLDDPAATAEAIDKDGWLHTGDVGRIDERGYLYITGRAKDIYIVGGFNCYPAEIEAMIQQHPAVADVAVVGVPDARMGEVGKAYIVLAQDAEPITEAEMIAWARKSMANFKVPREVHFLEALPRTPAGKVQKFRLAAGEFG